MTVVSAIQFPHFSFKKSWEETTFCKEAKVFYKSVSSKVEGKRFPERWKPWKIALVVWSGILLARVHLPAIPPVSSILKYFPGGYSNGYPKSRHSIGYLTEVGPVGLRIGDRIVPFDRNLLQPLELADEMETVASSDQNETVEPNPEPISKTDLENDPIIDFAEKPEEDENELQDAAQQILQENYQGNVEFVDPDEFLIYFEKDLSGGHSNDRLGVPFQVPVSPKQDSPAPRSNATFEQN